MKAHALLAAIYITSSVCAAQDKATPWTDERQRNVGILLFNDVQIIDYTGPFEVFLTANAAGWHAYEVFTVAESTAPIDTVGGMKVIPTHAFADHPDIDILVVPGGWGVWAQRENARVLDWIRNTARDAELVFSICTGAFLLSKVGLLDGQSATTNAGAVARLQREVPTCRVLGDQRVVDSGKVVTSAGLTAGIDGALHIIEKTIARGWAQMVSLWLEYDWRPESGYSAWKMAGRLVPPPVAFVVAGLPDTWSPVSYTGTANRWESIANVTSTRSDKDIHNDVAAILVERLQWEQQKADSGGPGIESAWSLANTTCVLVTWCSQMTTGWRSCSASASKMCSWSRSVSRRPSGNRPTRWRTGNPSLNSLG